jgi:hypothetical protein
MERRKKVRKMGKRRKIPKTERRGEGKGRERTHQLTYQERKGTGINIREIY